MTKELKSAPKGVGWGTTNVAKKLWIDPKKTYKTAKGKSVENLHIVLHNSCGDEVAYPVKGTIVLQKQPRKTTFAIWTLDGKGNLLPDTACWDNPSERNLIEVK